MTKCTMCRKNFTFFYRKHHCRICGNVFCNACTQARNIGSSSKRYLFIKFLEVEQNVRMCAACVQDLESFQKSLRNKTNLLNADMDRRGSFADGTDGGAQPEKAPRNRKESFDSGDEPDQVTTFLSF